MNLSKGAKVLLVVLALLVSAAFAGYKIIYKPHPKTTSQKALFTGAVAQFKHEAATNPERWQNAIVQLTGTITEVDDLGLMLDNTTFCQMSDSLATQGLSPKTNITLKGRFIGYDDLLEEVKLDKCIIK